MNENNPPINWQQLDDITGNDRELGLEFLEFFLENASTYIAELSVQNITPTEFNSICHKLKGAAKTVGAEHLAELAYGGEKLQEATKEEQKSLVIELKANIEHIRTSIM